MALRSFLEFVSFIGVARSIYFGQSAGWRTVIVKVVKLMGMEGLNVPLNFTQIG